MAGEREPNRYGLRAVLKINDKNVCCDLESQTDLFVEPDTLIVARLKVVVLYRVGIVLSERSDGCGGREGQGDRCGLSVLWVC